NYAFPEPIARYESLFNTTVPVLALSSIRSYLRSDKPAVRQQEKDCRIQWSHKADKSIFALYINNIMIGTLQAGQAHEDYVFDCSLLKESSNSVSIIRLFSEKPIFPEISAIRIGVQQKDLILNLEH